MLGCKHVDCLASNSYDCVEEVEKELNYVGKLLCDTALRTLPRVQHPSRQRWKDSTLSTLCSKSRLARKAWRGLEVLLMVLSMTRNVAYVELSGSASDSVLPKLKIEEFKRETICLPLIIRIAFGTHIIKGRFTLSFSSMMRLSRINSLC